MGTVRIRDVELAYEIHGSGEPLVLLHGAQSDRTIFTNVLSDFMRDFRVLIFDQRGSGQSSKPDMEYTIAMIADDTAALMVELGFSPAHVYGVSMGGMIAQELAIRHEALVRSLVLGCTTPGGDRAVTMVNEAIGSSHSTEALSAEERGGALARTAFTKSYIDQHPELIPALIKSRREQPLDEKGFERRMNAAYAHDTYERLSDISCPTLVITGENDALIAAENSDLLAQKIPHAVLVKLEPAGHAYWVEQPEQTKEAILRFLLES